MTAVLSPLTPLLGVWKTGGGPLPRPTQRGPVVARCMTCQIQAERQAGDALALDRLVDAEMVQRVIVWLATKGLGLE